MQTGTRVGDVWLAVYCLVHKMLWTDCPSCFGSELKKNMKLWVLNFRESDAMLNKERGRPCNSRTPENIEAARHWFLLSPKQSAHKYAAALQLFDQSMQRNLARGHAISSVLDGCHPRTV
ncbi:hypothetical protein PR048_011184 [Dryococelus australis]|uniref:Uncharacterized protein n=1 Tax=Dryococelus australis TaxID=614101 RepID=A0ABQ9HKW6_9NEOP|nr:hypothetical protein PR048_011184 [Dryococelus australis]